MRNVRKEIVEFQKQGKKRSATCRGSLKKDRRQETRREKMKSEQNRTRIEENEEKTEK